MVKKNFISPLIEVYLYKAEKGFQLSSENTTNSFGFGSSQDDDLEWK